MAFTQIFSQRFGYAVHALCYMARRPSDVRVTGPELAAWMRTFWPGTSETYLTNVIQRLARGGLLRSHRGVHGGYSLARSPETITVRDIVCLLDSSPPPECNLAPGGACPVHVGCGILHTLKGLANDCLELLDAVSIAQLSEGLGVNMPGEPAVITIES